MGEVWELLRMRIECWLLEFNVAKSHCTFGAKTKRVILHSVSIKNKANYFLQIFISPYNGRQKQKNIEKWT